MPSNKSAAPSPPPPTPGLTIEAPSPKEGTPSSSKRINKEKQVAPPKLQKVEGKVQDSKVAPPANIKVDSFLTHVRQLMLGVESKLVGTAAREIFEVEKAHAKLMMRLHYLYRLLDGTAYGLCTRVAKLENYLEEEEKKRAVAELKLQEAEDIAAKSLKGLEVVKAEALSANLAFKRIETLLAKKEDELKFARARLEKMRGASTAEVNHLEGII